MRQTRQCLNPAYFWKKRVLKPRAAQQIVLSGRVMEYASQVSWSFAKVQEPDLYLRDMDEDLLLALE